MFQIKELGRVQKRPKNVLKIFLEYQKISIKILSEAVFGRKSRIYWLCFQLRDKFDESRNKEILLLSLVYNIIIVSESYFPL